MPLSPRRKAAKVRGASALGVRLPGWLPEDVVMKPRVNSHNHRIPVDENSNNIHRGLETWMG
jgi:hypothetical protein